jgi:adenylate cyclase class 2
MPKNYELKVPIQNILRAKYKARTYISVKKNPRMFSESQKDIYYNVSKGRLKLRIIDGKRGTLIFYERKEKTGKRISNYLLAETGNPAELDNIMRKLYKVLVIVNKKREIYIANNVRIHVDKVRGLGNYLEFEIIFNSIREAKKTMTELITLFGLKENTFIKSSYSDLLLKEQLKLK